MSINVKKSDISVIKMSVHNDINKVNVTPTGTSCNIDTCTTAGSGF